MGFHPWPTFVTLKFLDKNTWKLVRTINQTAQPNHHSAFYNFISTTHNRTLIHEYHQQSQSTTYISMFTKKRNFYIVIEPWNSDNGEQLQNLKTRPPSSKPRKKGYTFSVTWLVESVQCVFSPCREIRLRKRKEGPEKIPWPKRAPWNGPPFLWRPH